MPRAWPLLLLAVACSEPDFFACDGGVAATVEGETVCLPADAGDAPAGDAGRDASHDGGRDAGRDEGRDGGRDPGDAPDCLDELDCPFDADDVLDLTTAAEASREALFDGADHRIPTACGPIVSADRDVFRVRAPVRAFVEIEVERAPGSAFEPVLETYDEAGLWILTYAGGERRARTRMIVPAPAPEALRVLVHHAPTYGSLCDGVPPSERGGPGFAYTVRARRCDGCEVVALGLGDATEVELTAPGDMTVFRLDAAPGDTASATIALAAGCPGALEGACWPILVPLRPGTRDIERAEYTNTNRPDWTGSDTRALEDAGPEGERYFAVYDYNGLGAPGYRVAVSTVR